MQLRGATIAVTGVGGFIGGAVAELARQGGARVVGLDLAARSAEASARCDRFVPGDITDPGALDAFCRGADAVVHAAALVAEGGPWALFRWVNVEGTRFVAGAAERAGVARLVHVSSIMVHGFSPPEGVHEEAPPRGDDNPYCQTKIEAEAAALAFDRPGAMRVAIARPGDVYGPRSEPWVTRPLDLMRRGLFAVPTNGGRLAPVHIDDLARGLLLCLDDAAAGEAFHLTGGESVPTRSYFERLARAGGQPVSRVRALPARALEAMLSAAEAAARLSGRAVPASPAAVRFLQRSGSYSIAKAKAKLGYAPATSLDEGLEALARHRAGPVAG